MEIEKKYYNILAGLVSEKEVEAWILLEKKEVFYYPYDPNSDTHEKEKQSRIKEETFYSKNTIEMLEPDTFELGFSDLPYDKLKSVELLDKVNYKFVPSIVIELFSYMIKKDKVRVNFDGEVRGSFIGYIDCMFNDDCAIVDDLDNDKNSIYIDYKRIYSVEKV